ncbi:hypothetical protein QZH41_000454 [Actinostola sp. cb2023]|nr:hypothetical protein QZH41_000454 [Actinostola sp. cb2023]
MINSTLRIKYPSEQCGSVGQKALGCQAINYQTALVDLGRSLVQENKNMCLEPSPYSGAHPIFAAYLRQSPL